MSFSLVYMTVSHPLDNKPGNSLLGRWSLSQHAPGCAMAFGSMPCLDALGFVRRGKKKLLDFMLDIILFAKGTMSKIDIALTASLSILEE